MNEEIHYRGLPPDVKAENSGAKAFDTKQEAVHFREEVLRNYPALGYGTTVTIIDPDEENASWIVEWYIGSTE